MEAIWSSRVRSEGFQKAFPHSTIFPVHSMPQIRYVSLTLHMRVERATRNPRSRSEERFSSQPGPVDQPDRTNPHTESYVAVGEIRWRPQARWVGEGFAEARSAPTGAD